MEYKQISLKFCMCSYFLIFTKIAWKHSLKKILFYCYDMS